MKSFIETKSKKVYDVSMKGWLNGTFITKRKLYCENIKWYGLWFFCKFNYRNNFKTDWICNSLE